MSVYYSIASAADVPPRLMGAPLSPSIVAGLVGIGDFLSITAPGVLIYLWYAHSSVESFQLYLSAIGIAAFLIIPAFYVAGLYRIEIVGRIEAQIRAALVICVGVALFLIALTFALKISAQFSRVWAFSWFLSATLLV